MLLYFLAPYLASDLFWPEENVRLIVLSAFSGLLDQTAPNGLNLLPLDVQLSISIVPIPPNPTHVLSKSFVRATSRDAGVDFFTSVTSGAFTEINPTTSFPFSHFINPLA